MGLEKRTVRIVVAVVVVLVVLGVTLGVLLALLLPHKYVELEVWPRTEEFGKWEEPRIEFRPDDPGSWHVWVRRIEDFLRVYETSVPEDPPIAPCWTGRRSSPPPSAACARALTLWRPCTAEHNYGFGHGTPCVFLRLSHIHKWHPEPYNNSVPLPLPPEMPPHLVNIIRGGSYGGAARLGEYAWVSCGGSLPADEEHIGPVRMLPAHLPPGFRLRRLHTAGRRRLSEEEPTPLLALLFENPRRGVVISVECRVWTRDLYYYYDGYYHYGRATFQIYIE